eukprot:7047516-Alexandrium_andersonii.AAC.1
MEDAEKRMLHSLSHHGTGPESAQDRLQPSQSSVYLRIVYGGGMHHCEEELGGVHIRALPV